MARWLRASCMWAATPSSAASLANRSMDPIPPCPTIYLIISLLIFHPFLIVAQQNMPVGASINRTAAPLPWSSPSCAGGTHNNSWYFPGVTILVSLLEAVGCSLVYSVWVHTAILATQYSSMCGILVYVEQVEVGFCYHVGRCCPPDSSGDVDYIRRNLHCH